MAQAAPLIRACLGGIADESEHLIVVSDAAGVLLQVHGDAGVRSRAADSMNFTEGALWSEAGAGTNAIGTALAADHAVQVFATEHFVEVVQAWTCAAAPVHDPGTGELLGVIDLTGLQRDVQPHSLAVAMTAARAVEGHLPHLLEESDERLRARYASRMTGGGERRALVAPNRTTRRGRCSGVVGDARLELPPGGGEIVLPSGGRAVAEPVGDEEAFILHELGGPRTPGRSPGDELRVLADEQAALRRLARPSRAMCPRARSSRRLSRRSAASSAPTKPPWCASSPTVRHGRRRARDRGHSGCGADRGSSSTTPGHHEGVPHRSVGSRR